LLFLYIVDGNEDTLRMKLERTNIKRILVIKLRAIGDVLLSTVVIRNLRTAFPDAQIDFLTERLSREVLEGNSDLHSVLVFDNKRDNGVKLLLDVRSRNYDLVFDLFGNPRSALITYFSGATYRVGYRFKWRQYCYTTVVEPRGGEVHNTEFNLDALRSLEIPVPDTSIVFPLSREAEKFAEEFFQKNSISNTFVVALNPGGGWYTKRWKAGQFAELGDLLTKEYHARILIIWGPGEEAEAKNIQRQMNSPSMIIPNTSLQQLAAILKRCSVMVTNDSGPMHIAAAMNTPIVAMFGPTNPELQGPVGHRHEIVQHQGLLCLGCNYTSCPIGNPCMEELTAAEVFAACEALIEKNNLVAEHLS
jgi:lipopolysaccharide heptosyltransferase II